MRIWYLTFINLYFVTFMVQHESDKKKKLYLFNYKIWVFNKIVLNN